MGLSQSKREAKLKRMASESEISEIVCYDGHHSTTNNFRQQEFYAALDLSWLHSLVSVSERGKIAHMIVSNESFTLVGLLSK